MGPFHTERLVVERRGKNMWRVSSGPTWAWNKARVNASACLCACSSRGPKRPAHVLLRPQYLPWCWAQKSYLFPSAPASYRQSVHSSSKSPSNLQRELVGVGSVPPLKRWLTEGGSAAEIAHLQRRPLKLTGASPRLENKAEHPNPSL